MQERTAHGRSPEYDSTVSKRRENPAMPRIIYVIGAALIISDTSIVLLSNVSILQPCIPTFAYFLQQHILAILICFTHISPLILFSKANGLVLSAFLKLSCACTVVPIVKLAAKLNHNFIHIALELPCRRPIWSDRLPSDHLWFMGRYLKN